MKQLFKISYSVTHGKTLDLISNDFDELCNAHKLLMCRYSIFNLYMKTGNNWEEIDKDQLPAFK